MPRHHFTTDAHFEVGDHVLVRGVRACVRMETATQVLVVFDQAQGGQQEEWVQKSSPALKLARNSASLAATAAAAAHGGAGDPDEELSSEGEDDECNICGNGGKHTSVSRVAPQQRHSLLPWSPGADTPGSWLRHQLGLSRCAAQGPNGRAGRRRRSCGVPLPRLTCCDVCPRVYHLRCLPLADVEALKEMGDEGEWWCPHCRRLSRVTFCTFRMLSESCTPHAPVDVNASAEELYTFMQDEQHADTFDVVRHCHSMQHACNMHATCMWSYCNAHLAVGHCNAHLHAHCNAHLHAHCMCTACALHVHCMCTACALHVHCMCTACALHVHCVCTRHALGHFGIHGPQASG